MPTQPVETRGWSWSSPLIRLLVWKTALVKPSAEFHVAYKRDPTFFTALASFLSEFPRKSEELETRVKMVTKGGARKKFEMTTFLEERSRPVTEVQNVVGTYSVTRRNQTTLLPVSRAALNHSASDREQNLAKPKESKEKPTPSRKVKSSALKHEASARQQELAQPKEKRNADAEPMPWQISQDYKGPQRSRGKGAEPHVTHHDCVTEAVRKEREGHVFRASPSPLEIVKIGKMFKPKKKNIPAGNSGADTDDENAVDETDEDASGEEPEGSGGDAEGSGVEAEGSGEKAEGDVEDEATASEGGNGRGEENEAAEGEITGDEEDTAAGNDDDAAGNEKAAGDQTAAGDENAAEEKMAEEEMAAEEKASEEEKAAEIVKAAEERAAEEGVAEERAAADGNAMKEDGNNAENKERTEDEETGDDEG